MDKELLDYFAGKAMQVMYMEGISNIQSGFDSPKFSVIAQDAYRLAEAMMEEKRKNG